MASDPEQQGARFIIICTGPRQGEVFPLSGRTFLIGRAPECDLRLVDAFVSRHHCLLERTGDEWSVRDLGSRNGTWVDERPIAGPAELTPGVMLRVGRTYLLYSDEERGQGKDEV